MAGGAGADRAGVPGAGAGAGAGAGVGVGGGARGRAAGVDVWATVRKWLVTRSPRKAWPGFLIMTGRAARWRTWC